MNMNPVVGRCLRCGGLVAVPAGWGGGPKPAAPACETCSPPGTPPYFDPSLAGPAVRMAGLPILERAEALSDRHERLHNRDGKVEGVDR